MIIDNTINVPSAEKRLNEARNLLDTYSNEIKVKKRGLTAKFRIYKKFDELHNAYKNNILEQRARRAERGERVEELQEYYDKLLEYWDWLPQNTVADITELEVQRMARVSNINMMEAIDVFESMMCEKGELDYLRMKYKED